MKRYQMTLCLETILITARNEGADQIFDIPNQELAHIYLKCVNPYSFDRIVVYANANKLMDIDQQDVRTTLDRVTKYRFSDEAGAIVFIPLSLFGYSVHNYDSEYRYETKGETRITMPELINTVHRLIPDVKVTIRIVTGGMDELYLTVIHREDEFHENLQPCHEFGNITQPSHETNPDSD